MKTLTVKKFMIVLLLGLAAWGLCAAVMGIGMATLSVENALIIHAFAAPVIAFVISFIYYKKFNFTTPVQTATIFLTIIFLMDFFVVAMLINKSMDMFTSFIGTWLPFMLIFTATYVTGRLIKK